MFKQRINHATGQREWVVNEDDFDVAQELARSRFADMILDYDRNDKFLAGLKTVLEEKRLKGDKTHVLDIGTGTGLLSLMAAREGADRVTAVEVFEPMAKCAKKIIEKTQWKDKITVLSTRSTELTHLNEKPNIIVAEVFDTELIGEGALRTFKEAVTKLAQPGCRVIPSLGRIFILPVQSKFLKKFNVIPEFNFDDVEVDDTLLGYCPGTAAVFDLQLSRVNLDYFIPLSDPILAIEFDFENTSLYAYDETYNKEVICTRTGEVDAILMWWELDMDRQGKNFISTAPSWLTPNFKWRDHWMQAVYYPAEDVTLKQGQNFQLNITHDEFSLWFSIGEKSIPRPYCQCNLHNILSRQSIYGLNELTSNIFFPKLLKKFENKTVLVLGEGSLLGIVAAHFAKNVIIFDSNTHFRMILFKYLRYYKLNFKVKCLVSLSELTDLDYKPDVIIGEPFYISAMNPWQNLRFWHEANECKILLGMDIPVYPKQARLRGIFEKFTNLHTTSCPVGVVNEFDLSYFDKISNKAREATDAIVDEHPLWEYEGVVTSNIFDVCTFDLNTPPSTSSIEVKLSIPNGTNGIPLWIDWDFEELFVRTTGINDGEAEIGKDPMWSIGCKQGVYFPTTDLLRKNEVTLKVRYSGETGDMIFNFL